MVVDEHPAALGLSGLLGNLGLGHHGFAVTGVVCNFDHEGRSVFAANEAWHQADSAAGFQVHLSDVAGTDQLVVDEHPAALGLSGLLSDFILGHQDCGVS